MLKGNDCQDKCLDEQTQNIIERFYLMTNCHVIITLEYFINYAELVWQIEMGKSSTS